MTSLPFILSSLGAAILFPGWHQCSGRRCRCMSEYFCEFRSLTANPKHGVRSAWEHVWQEIIVLIIPYCRDPFKLGASTRFRQNSQPGAHRTCEHQRRRHNQIFKRGRELVARECLDIMPCSDSTSLDYILLICLHLLRDPTNNSLLMTSPIQSKRVQVLFFSRTNKRITRTLESWSSLIYGEPFDSVNPGHSSGHIIIEWLPR
jgi:hypothetical protein